MKKIAFTLSLMFLFLSSNLANAINLNDFYESIINLEISNQGRIESVSEERTVIFSDDGNMFQGNIIPPEVLKLEEVEREGSKGEEFIFDVQILVLDYDTNEYIEDAMVLASTSYSAITDDLTILSRLPLTNNEGKTTLSNARLKNIVDYKEKSSYIADFVSFLAFHPNYTEFFTVRDERFDTDFIHPYHIYTALADFIHPELNQKTPSGEIRPFIEKEGDTYKITMYMKRNNKPININKADSNSKTNEPQKQINIPLPEEGYGVVHGTITDPKGKPIEGIRVEVHSEPLYTITNAEGYYIFNKVEYGEHTVILKDADTLRELGRIDIVVDKANNLKDQTETKISLAADNRIREVDFLLIAGTSTTTPLNVIPPILAAGTFLLFGIAYKKRKNVKIYENGTMVKKVLIRPSNVLEIHIDKYIKSADKKLIELVFDKPSSKKLKNSQFTIYWNGESIDKENYKVHFADGEFKIKIEAWVSNK